ncbi:Mbeg1-like protein, partial [Clostridium sp.]|uniref:Mbeg1-like protein n=1 Tax=Clostridium sp. TaxID=1506 RepID=UPI001D6059FD
STKYETDQQKAAKDFLNEVGLEYDSIYLTGHSKGGNNAIYATIAANSDIRSKIEDCVTFNAPGFSDKFIKDQKYVIEQLNKRGIFREYQGSSDLVSSIMNNVSIPLIISQRDLDKSSLERLKAFDDHYIYAMEVDGDAFILDNDGKKAFIPILVNNLVAGLTQTLTDKEIDEIISLAYNIINKDEDAGAADIYKMILNSGVDISTVNIILLQVITEANITYLKESPNGFVTRIGYIAELYRDTRIFIYSNISRTKNYIVDGLLKLGESIEKLGLSNMRDILNIGFKLSIGSIFTRKISPIIADLNSSGIISNKCLVTVDDINTSLRGYKAELINIREYFKNIDVAIKKLVELGWSGNASQSFYLAKFTDVKSSMDTIESQLRYMVRYLEKAKNGFESIELEEDALVGILD